MSHWTPKPRLPWHERWEKPTLEQLLEPLGAQRRRHLELIIEQLDESDILEQEIFWYGPGWYWTIQYRLKNTDNPDRQIFCFLVPDPERPLVCIPLYDEQIEALPIRRLNKYIRNGIRSAKCAVTIHWAQWHPTNQTEVSYLTDLLKRKLKLQRDLKKTPEKPAAKKTSARKKTSSSKTTSKKPKATKTTKKKSTKTTPTKKKSTAKKATSSAKRKK